MQRAVQPAAIEAAILAHRDEATKKIRYRCLARDLVAARYAAQPAHRQYDAADRENRGNGALDRRWNEALEPVHEIEDRIDHRPHARGGAGTDASRSFDLAARLEEISGLSRTDARLRKRIVRSLIHEVNVDLDNAARKVSWSSTGKAAFTQKFICRAGAAAKGAHIPPATLDACVHSRGFALMRILQTSSTGTDCAPGREILDPERVRRSAAIIKYPSTQRATRKEGWLNLTAAAG